MYIPSRNKVTDVAQISDLIRTYPFGILVTSRDNKPIGTHLPFLLSGSAEPGGMLLSHMAKANPQWRIAEGDVLVVFNGPHAYISSSWYEQNDGVPTWNYAAVHVYGTLRLFDDPEASLQLLKETIATFDSTLVPMWEDPKHLAYFQRQARGVVGFEIAITSVEAKWKMSQNRSEEDRRRVVEALLNQRTDEEPHKVAKMIKGNE